MPAMNFWSSLNLKRKPRVSKSKNRKEARIKKVQKQENIPEVEDLCACLALRSNNRSIRSLLQNGRRGKVGMNVKKKVIVFLYSLDLRLV